MADKKKLVRKTVRMSQEMAEFLEKEAESMGISQSAFMVVLLSEYRKNKVFIV